MATEIDGELHHSITILRADGNELVEVSEVRFINTYQPE